MEPTDFFALLGVPRSAHLDEAILRDRYHDRVRALVDPSTGGGEEGRLLHRAHEVLADPVRRVRHLLDLTAPGRPGGGAPLSGDLLGLFPEVGAALNRADELLGRLGRMTSSLGRALLAPEEAEAQVNLQEMLGRLTGEWNQEISRLTSLSATDTDELESSLGTLRVLQKWKGEVQARLLRFLAG